MQMMLKRHILIIVLAVAIILMLVACVNDNLNGSETTKVVSGSGETLVSDTETCDPSETTDENGGFWLPTDEF